MNDDRIGTDNYIISDADSAQHFSPCTDINVIADPWRPSCVASTRVTQGHPMANQAIIAHHGCSMDDDTTMMFYRKAPSNAGTRTNSDPKEYFNQLVQHYVNKGPGRTNDFISNDESAVSEAVHEQRPKSQAKQPFTLRTAIFANDIHAGYCRVSMDDWVRGMRH